MDRLKGKVPLISGGARGQGAAEARLFVMEGAKVVIGDVLDDQCRKTADEINAKVSAKSVVPLHLDVTRAADWRAAVESCQREFGWSRHPRQQRRHYYRRRYRGNHRRGMGLRRQHQPEGRVARDEVCGPRDAPARSRFDHQHLFDLRSDWLWRFRHLSWHQGRRSPPH